MNKYGLIGKPLSHSFSEKYFSDKFIREGISDCQYNLYPLESIDLLPELLLKHPNLKGLNVTTPYKVAVLPYLDEIDPIAEIIGAVNCISITYPSGDKPFLKGYNTDAFGFRQSIKPFLETQHERALILGTGGASKAVHQVLKEIGIDCFFVSQNKWKVKSEKVFSYNELTEYIIHSFKLIINASPVGTYPHAHQAPEIPYQHITSSHLLYDLVYNPPETEFMKKGKAMGASVVNGLSMLHQQAEEAWRIWNHLVAGK
ncbi:MAG: shikimate dehydrogenase [Bacteroidota bacterium]|nr:shikimate dehydrogenase [Bacteroidota bacterium]